MGQESKNHDSPTDRVLSDAAPRAAAPYAGIVVCAFLLLAVALVFGQTLRHGFVNYDDEKYVCKNPQVDGGLTIEGIRWAFASRHASNWHPLTWLSHMLDCQLYGLAPWGHHLTSVLLHAATAILLFLVLRRMAGDLWPSTFVAVVFAVHPLRVESVAWVAERKDVLSGLFFLLTLGAYLGYVRHPFSLARYLAVAGLFALGLMAKPMLVTLPLVLLLLDYWPLRRMVLPSCPPWQLVVEKLPLLVLSAASCAATLWAQSEALAATDQVPLPWRIGNAAVSYVVYLGQSFWPAGLTVLYPHPGLALSAWKATAAILALGAICGIVVALRRRCPYLLVGWFWYLGMLLPVIGLVQVGLQARADRYTYLPQIGLCIAMAWGANHVTQSWPHRDLVCGIGAALTVTTLMACAWQQTTHWLNSETLWNRALACTTGNYTAHYNLGVALADQGRLDAAIQQYRAAVQAKPDYAEAHYNLGLILANRGQVDEAMEHYQAAADVAPDFSEAHNKLGIALVGRGRFDEAIAHYRAAIKAKPDYAEAHNNLGSALASKGEVTEAMEHFLAALEIQPNYAEAHNNLGASLEACGNVDEAIAQYEQAIKIKPDYAEAHNNLGALLGRQGSLSEAIAHFRRALEIDPQHAGARRNLGIAVGQQGGGL